MAEERLSSQVIVITGASSGFGKGMALRCAEAGAAVVLAARRGELLDELVRTCEERGGRALSVPTDVSEPEQVESLGRAALERFGRIDVWVNDAGGAALGLFDEVPLEEHLQVIRTDLFGVLVGSWVALRHFKARKKGVVINLASALGKVPAPYYASYTAAKYGVVGLSAALRQELSVAGLEDVHVCTVLPASHDTPFFEHAANSSRFP
jgi:NAD(P)-dependent dehydrogenase (short-subunit alcohol dehydrogenase family)